MSSSDRSSFTRQSGRDGPIQIHRPQSSLFRLRQGFGPDADHLRRRGREPCGNPLERLARPDGEHGPFARLVRSPPPSDVGIDPRRLQLAGRRIFKADDDAVRLLFVDLRPPRERPCRLQMSDDVGAVLAVEQVDAPFARQGFAPLERRRIPEERPRVAPHVPALRNGEAGLPGRDLADQLPQIILGEEGPKLSRRHRARTIASFLPGANATGSTRAESRAGVSASVLLRRIHFASAAAVNGIEPPPSVWTVRVCARGSLPYRTANANSSRDNLRAAVSGAVSWSSAANARAASTRPCWTPRTGTVEAKMAFRTCATVAFGCTAHSRAAIPATCGAAMLVPS